MHHKHSRLIRFLHYAICIWENNPNLNLSAICTVMGLGALGVCALIETCGFGVAPPYIIDIGQMAFSFGIGGAVERSKANKVDNDE